MHHVEFAECDCVQSPDATTHTYKKTHNNTHIHTHTHTYQVEFAGCDCVQSLDATCNAHVRCHVSTFDLVIFSFVLAENAIALETVKYYLLI